MTKLLLIGMIFNLSAVHYDVLTPDEELVLEFIQDPKEKISFNESVKATRDFVKTFKK